MIRVRRLLSVLLVSAAVAATGAAVAGAVEIMLRPGRVVMRRRHQVVLRLLLLPVPELAVRPLAAALDEILTQRVVRLVAVAVLGPVEHVGRQLTGRPEALLFALRAVQELTARPVAHAVLEVVAEGVLLHRVVLGSLVQVFASLAPVADIPQEVSADPAR